MNDGTKKDDEPPSWIMDTLHYAYDLATKLSIGKFHKNAFELAEEYMKSGKTPDAAVDDLINWQIGKTAIAGFVTGMPGLIAMPVTVPVDLASMWYIQLRMVAAISVIYGHQPQDDKVRTLCYLALLGSGAQEAIGKTGVVISTKLSISALKQVPGHALIAINKAVGFRLFTKFGTKGAINLVRAIPLIGGVVNATVNGVGTAMVGRAAKKMLRPPDVS